MAHCKVIQFVFSVHDSVKQSYAEVNFRSGILLKRKRLREQLHNFPLKVVPMLSSLSFNLHSVNGMQESEIGC